jgi:hypothetical protein
MKGDFQVVNLKTKDVIEFIQVPDEDWRVITKMNNSTSTRRMNVKLVEKTYNYFSSHWMDYEINYETH